MKAESICVATLTFRRNRDLARLLPLLAQQIAPLARGRAVSLMVVDNSPEGAARATVRTALSDTDVPIRYVVETRPGISAARNRALAENAETDLLVFIDDDETPWPGWLAALVAAFERYRPAAVVGPVIAQYEVEPDPWIVAGGFFDRPTRETGDLVPGGGAGNILLDLRFLRGHALTFDEALGLIGGEDSLLTRQMIRCGGQIVWSAEAGVVDMIPADRATRAWVLRRQFRYGAAGVLISAKMAPTRSRILLVYVGSIALGMWELGTGAARWLVAVMSRSPGRRVLAVRALARAAGRFMGGLGVQHREYRRREL